MYHEMLDPQIQKIKEQNIKEIVHTTHVHVYIPLDPQGDWDTIQTPN